MFFWNKLEILDKKIELKEASPYRCLLKQRANLSSDLSFLSSYEDYEKEEKHHLEIRIKSLEDEIERIEKLIYFISKD